MLIKNDQHYNRVTDAWQDIMGNNFHFGYFENPQVPLPQATDALIDKMATLVNITEKTTILDVGCGIGGPALYLANKYNCSICGITTSEKGVAIAKTRSQNNGSFGRIEFRIADGTNNGFPDNGFDIVWVMESSHLMKQPALIRECYRVLKPKGVLLLCDAMIRYNEVVRNIAIITKAIIKFKMPKFVFGNTRTRSLEYYWRIIHKCGFNDITTIDISEEVFPTMAHWKQNINNNEAEIFYGNKYTKQEINDFIQSCDKLEMIFRHNILGYAIIKAVKPK